MFLTDDWLDTCRSSVVSCSSLDFVKILFSFCLGFEGRDKSYVSGCIVLWQEMLATGKLHIRKHANELCI